MAFWRPHDPNLRAGDEAFSLCTASITARRRSTQLVTRRLPLTGHDPVVDMEERDSPGMGEGVSTSRSPADEAASVVLDRLLVLLQDKDIKVAGAATTDSGYLCYGWPEKKVLQLLVKGESEGRSKGVVCSATAYYFPLACVVLFWLKHI